MKTCIVSGWMVTQVCVAPSREAVVLGGRGGVARIQASLREVDCLLGVRDEERLELEPLEGP